MSQVYLQLSELGRFVISSDFDSSLSLWLFVELTRWLQYKKYFNSPNSVKQGGITASMAGGSLLGCLFASWSGDRFGRRDSMFIACLIWLVGSTLMCAVQNTAMLIVSRIINGFAVGILTSQG